MLASLNDVVILGGRPPSTVRYAGLGWAVGSILVGALFFISREREFAVRL